MKEINYKILGMSCNHCVMAVKKELSKLAVNSFDVEIGAVKIVYGQDNPDENEIVAAIEEAGFRVAK